MKFLAWDTSSKAGFIFAFDWLGESTSPRVISEWNLNVEAAHSEQLLWGLHQTLTACGWKLSDVDVLCVGTGPGSFTGLRIGVSTAKALKLASSAQLIAFNSLAPYLGAAAQFQAKDTHVVFARDAAKGEWFVSHALAAKAKLGLNHIETDVFAPEDLVKYLKKKKFKKLCLIGETDSLTEKLSVLFPKSKQVEFEAQAPHRPSSQLIAAHLAEKYRAGRFESEDSLVPHYARLSEPEIRLQKGLLKPARTRGLNFAGKDTV